MCIIVDTSPYSCNVEAEKLWDSQGISIARVLWFRSLHMYKQNILPAKISRSTVYDNNIYALVNLESVQQWWQVIIVTMMNKPTWKVWWQHDVQHNKQLRMLTIIYRGGPFVNLTTSCQSRSAIDDSRPSSSCSVPPGDAAYLGTHGSWSRTGLHLSGRG